jgi:hypothetical protein
MTEDNDWFPSKELEMLALIGVWDPILANAAKRTAYGWDPTDCAATQAAMEEFKTAWQDYKDFDTSKNLSKKKAAKKKAAASMRDFAATHIRPNKKMPPEEKEAMGVRTTDTILTPGSDVTEGMNMSSENDRLTDSHIQYIHYKRFGVLSKAKYPYYQAIFQICIRNPGEGEPNIQDDSMWSQDITNMASPFRIQHNPDDSGKDCWYRARWQAKSGKKGPWTMFRARIS